MSSPTQRSLQALRKAGWTCAIVEKWNAHIQRRQDLFGFADLLAYRGDETRLIQTTTGSNVAARMAKIMANVYAMGWLTSKNRTIHVHGWRQVGARGQDKVWDCRDLALEIEPGEARRAMWQLLSLKPDAQRQLLELNFTRTPEAEMPGKQSAAP